MRGLVKNRSLVSMAFVVGCSLLMTTGKDATLEAQALSVYGSAPECRLYGASLTDKRL